MSLATKNAGLKKKMMSLGNLKGRPLSEISSLCGPPQESVDFRFTDIGPGTRKTWTDSRFSVTLNFDKNDICYGVAAQKSLTSEKTGNIIIIVIGIIMAILMVRCCLADSGPSEYSKLSPQEQENAKWAYEVQQAINGDD